MASFDKESSFLRRTAQEAERRATVAKLIPEMTAGILPIFWSKSFIFEEGEEPEHINNFPTRPQYLNLFEVRGGGEIDRAHALAVDIPSFAVASLIATARVRLLEASQSRYSYTESVWIVRPDRVVEQVYKGKLDED